MRILAIALVWLGTSAFTQTFDAKVVGVHDGDTITVYDGREQTLLIKQPFFDRAATRTAARLREVP